MSSTMNEASWKVYRKELEQEKTRKKEQEEKKRNENLEKREREKEFFYVDPSGFLSYDLLSDLLKVLQDLRDEKKASSGNVLIPSSLYYRLPNLQERQEVHPDLVEIFQLWLPFYVKEDVQKIMQSLADNSEYRGQLRRFWEEFRPVRATEYTSNVHRIGNESILEETIHNKFGKIPGGAIFEMLAVSALKKAKIISFADRSAHLLKELGITIKEGVSSVKDEIKKRKKVAASLKIAGYFLNIDEAKEFIKNMHLSISLEGIAISTIVTSGILIIADGFW